MTTIAHLIAGLALAELVHNYFEIWGILQKTDWHRKSLRNIGHKPWPVNIDSKIKVFSLHLSMLVIPTALAMIALSYLNISASSAMLVAITLLLLNYAMMVVKVDRWHTKIDKMIKRAKK